ncbi:Asp-tRNAAsn/Glu-tRNAGln amidotransferase A subunit [Algoriphagus ornithinivorans]|uniref:Asp-tRNAAsn/Glu-tRNAGln amidotransferase A subunit n=2 Tax=Algoriphagus TaxID=246875 RepID=A0A1I5FZ95_9BACT|nr:amidase family protein [Algoriphagus ornithinivorans]SFO29020.1 Asp-tRNAAsn/Glu-tRNAGln amidotransferase A subunit [Algoriphagus ornithinivorans]
MKHFICIIGVLGLFFSCNTKKDISLEELTISQIHEAYKNGDYTAEDLVRAYIYRIEENDSAINSISEINPVAIGRARALDAEFAATGNLRPLHGIPVIVKDNINTIGLPTSAGALALKDFYPETDAFIIQKLEEAGAIVLAKSNMAEWAFSPMHSESSTKGITRNPYNLDHVPAGSSGGTGAAVAANFGTLGIGTDTGNSIRGPSSHNALVGFRTSLGLISREGIVPLYLRNDVVGPMCRTVEDATRMLDIMAGKDPKDPITNFSEGKIPDSYMDFLDKNGLQEARIGVFRTLSENNIHPEISSLFNKALEDMADLGAVIVDSVEVENFQELRQNQWCADFRKDLEAFLAEYVKRDTLSSLEDVVRIGTKSDFARTRLEMFVTNFGRGQSPEIPCGDAFTDLRRVAFREAIEKTMDSLNLDVLVYPSWNQPAATIVNFQEEYKGDNSQIIAPHTRQPAFTVPMGFVSGNLPAGIQFLGRVFDEKTLVKLTYAYEQGTKHRKAPN